MVPRGELRAGLLCWFGWLAGSLAGFAIEAWACCSLLRFACWPGGTWPRSTAAPPTLSSQQVVGDGRCPIVDTWWQTETAGHMITPLPAAWPEKPGSGESDWQAA